MRFKEAFQCPRPVEYSPDVMPIIPTPEHCTLPSGHSTESFAIAHTLRALFDAAKVKNPAIHSHMIEMAQQVAQNRTVAGLHFPVDSAVGCALGTSMAEYFVQRCTGKGGWESRSFECDKFVDPTGPKDFSAEEVLFSKQPYLQTCPEGQSLPGGYLMPQMWAWAVAEWA